MTSIAEFQSLMKRLYGVRDNDRGPLGTMLWLFSEVGELSEAVVKRKPIEVLRGELADVLAWLCSICNVLCIDLEASATSKYGGKCPRCRGDPCKCAKK